MLFCVNITSGRSILFFILATGFIIYWFLLFGLDTILSTRSSNSSGGSSCLSDKFYSLGLESKTFQCVDPVYRENNFVLRGQFYILYDFIPAARKFKCHESITYTAPADLNYLDNLAPVLNRWHGPLSISLYTPGTDFKLTVDRIGYLRQCGSPLIRELVTFHFFFESSHFPADFAIPDWTTTYDCNDKDFLKPVKTYKQEKKLLYPLNAGRNIARDRSQTHFYLISDIELYPSVDFIPNFMAMLNNTEITDFDRKVFVLPPFEIQGTVSIEDMPLNKEQLQKYLANKTAVSFHDTICPNCHRFPGMWDWLKAPVTSGMSVFQVSKRVGRFSDWEPMYVGTPQVPSFDERFTWESNKDKQMQCYLMCIMDYEFHILDNAFLMHRPGIKKSQSKPQANQMNKDLSKFILPEMHKLYGTRRGCTI